MNNSNSIIKIVIWSIVALFFTSIMILIAISDNFMDIFTNDYHDIKSIRTTEIDVSKIDTLNIDYTYGNVNISTYDGDKIVIDEKSNRDIDEDELFDIDEDEETLYLKQPREINMFNFFGSINKRMIRDIKLPKKLYNEIKVKLTSGNLDVKEIETDIFDVKMTSGNTETSNLIANDLVVNMTSGNAHIDGSFKDVKTNATSGNIKVNSDTAPSTLLVDITSGNVSISIPENDGFMLSKEKTSGTFRSDFKLDDYNIYKNGKNKYKVKMTSGNVKLLRTE